ncbi:hypothetical protein [Comamonas sp. JC664]|uniref:hypothetical protein n=1 Tax=Comamonas sp. JC664 TaxID=2801917 RepID=UPI003622BA4F
MTKGETLYYDFAFANQPAACSTPRSTRAANGYPPLFIDVDLEVPDSSLGNELQIRVVGADCSQGGHGGYVYVDALARSAFRRRAPASMTCNCAPKPGNVQLTWADTGAASYAVYRADKLEGPFVRLGTTQSRHSTCWTARCRRKKPTTTASGAGCGWPCAVQLWRGSDLCACALECGRPVNRPPIFTSQPVLAGDVRNCMSTRPRPSMPMATRSATS